MTSTSSSEFLPGYRFRDLQSDHDLLIIAVVVILVHVNLLILSAFLPDAKPLPPPVKQIVVKTITLGERPPPPISIPEPIAVSEPIVEALAEPEPIPEPEPVVESVKLPEPEPIAIAEPQPIVDEVAPPPQPPEPIPQPVREPEPIAKKEEVKPAPVKKPIPIKKEVKKPAPAKKAAPIPKSKPKPPPKAKPQSKPKPKSEPKPTPKKPQPAKKSVEQPKPKPKESAPAKPKVDPQAEAAKAKKRDLLAKAQKSIAQIATSDTVASSSTTSAMSAAIPGRIDALQVETFPDSTEGALSPQEMSYYDELASRLKLLLRLPEFGEVKVKLTLERSGQFVKVSVVNALSQNNKKYVEKTLPTLKYPSFGNNFNGLAQYTFVIALSNEL